MIGILSQVGEIGKVPNGVVGRRPTPLRDFTDHAPTVTTDAQSLVTITIPRNDNGNGYVCYARPAQVGPFPASPVATIQDYEGASDLDIKSAVDSERVLV